MNITDNGALAFREHLNPWIDFLFKIPSGRENPTQLLDIFQKLFYLDSQKSFKLLFYVRDRDEKGERNLFRSIILFMKYDNQFCQILKRNIQQIPDFGRWDDLVFMIENDILKEDCFQLIQNQFQQDLKNSGFNNQQQIITGETFYVVNETNKNQYQILQKQLKDLDPFESDEQPQPQPQTQPQKMINGPGDKFDEVVQFVKDQMKDFQIQDAISPKSPPKFQISEIENQNLVSENISLLAKWLPGQQQKSFKLFAQKLSQSQRLFRHQLSYLRGKLNVVEKIMCQGNFQGIDYAKLPSRSLNYHRAAFLKHDQERFQAFLDSEKPINSKMLYPYEILNHHRIETEDHTLIIKQWESMPEIDLDDLVPVIDVSGSMTSGFNKTIQKLDIAISLGLYCASKNKKMPFQFITFSSEPEIVNINPKLNIVQQYLQISRANWSQNTDFRKVQELVQQKEIKRVIVFSDMQFDQTGSELPFQQDSQNQVQFIFYNLSGNNQSIPTCNPNVLEFGGFDANIFKHLKNIQSYDDLIDELLKKYLIL